MALSHKHVGSKILPKIKLYIHTRAELLINLCYEIPCTIHIWRLYQSINQNLSSIFDLFDRRMNQTGRTTFKLNLFYLDSGLIFSIHWKKKIQVDNLATLIGEIPTKLSTRQLIITKHLKFLLIIIRRKKCLSMEILT